MRGRANDDNNNDKNLKIEEIWPDIKLYNSK